MVAQTIGRFAWAKDVKDWALKTGQLEDGTPTFEVSSDPDNTYAGPKDLWAKFKENREVAKAWFIDGRATSTNLGATNGQKANGKILSREAFDTLSAIEKPAFFKNGGVVED